MAFFKRDQIGSLSGQDLGQKPIGRVYLMRFELECGSVLYKLGKSSGKSSKERMLQIIGSFFDKYRYTPKVSIRLDMKTIVPLLVEKHMHKLLDSYSCTFEKKFDGSTEFFYDIDPEEVISYMREFPYNKLLAGPGSTKSEDYDDITDYLAKTRSNQTGDSTDELNF